MEIWISILRNANGEMDVELLDQEPAESFRDDLWDALVNGDIDYWEIRCGNVNGGDSRIEYSSHG